MRPAGVPGPVWVSRSFSSFVSTRQLPHSIWKKLPLRSRRKKLALRAQIESGGHHNSKEPRSLFRQADIVHLEKPQVMVPGPGFRAREALPVATRDVAGNAHHGATAGASSVIAGDVLR